MENKSKSILVSGGAGYIGSHICKALKQSGYLPITLDDLSQGHKEFVRFGPLEIGNIKDEKWVRSIIQKYQSQAVIHCGGFISVNESVTNPALYYDNNVAASISLLNAMIKEQIKYLVFSSTCAVHGRFGSSSITENDPCEPANPYGRSKWMIEQIIKDYSAAYDLSYVNLRYFNAAGADHDCEIGELHEPETHAIPLAIAAIMAGKDFMLYGTDYPTKDGTAVRDYIHVTDLAHAHLLAVDYLKKGQTSCTINIGTGKGISVKELIAAIEKVTGKKIMIKQMGRREGDVAELVANPKRAKEFLGFSPNFSNIETIVKTAWKWHKFVEQQKKL